MHQGCFISRKTECAQSVIALRVHQKNCALKSFSEHYIVSGTSTGIGPSAIVRSMKAAHLRLTHAWAWSALPRNGEWMWPVYRASRIKESQRKKGPLHLG